MACAILLTFSRLGATKRIERAYIINVRGVRLRKFPTWRGVYD